MQDNNREILVFGKDRIIFSQGELSECMYEVRRGSVGIFTDYGTPKERMLTKIRKGENFGEMGLIDAKPRSASAVALERNTKVDVISAETFGSYLNERPEKMITIMLNMSRRIRTLTRDYMDVCRAVSEMVDTEKTGKQKSGWFESHVQGFIDDFRASTQEAE